MLKLYFEVHIEAPLNDVWDVMSRFDEVDRWTTEVTKSYYVDERKACVGAERACETPKNGTIKEKITDWQPNKSFTYEASTPITNIAQNTWTISPCGDATKVSFSPVMKVKLGPLGWLIEAALLKPYLNRVLPRVMNEFKYYVEHGEALNDHKNKSKTPQSIT